MGDFTPLETMRTLDRDTVAAITSVNARRFLNLS
jgi:hypothetical protein